MVGWILQGMERIWDQVTFCGRVRFRGKPEQFYANSCPGLNWDAYLRTYPAWGGRSHSTSLTHFVGAGNDKAGWAVRWLWIWSQSGGLCQVSSLLLVRRLHWGMELRENTLHSSITVCNFQKSRALISSSSEFVWCVRGYLGNPIFSSEVYEGQTFKAKNIHLL